MNSGIRAEKLHDLAFLSGVAAVICMALYGHKTFSKELS